MRLVRFVACGGMTFCNLPVSTVAQLVCCFCGRGTSKIRTQSHARGPISHVKGERQFAGCHLSQPAARRGRLVAMCRKVRSKVTFDIPRKSALTFSLLADVRCRGDFWPPWPFFFTHWLSLDQIGTLFLVYFAFVCAVQPVWHRLRSFVFVRLLFISRQLEWIKLATRTAPFLSILFYLLACSEGPGSFRS